MLKIKVNERKYFTHQQEQKHIIACELLEKAVNSDEFKKRVMASNFVQTNNLTNDQILNLILSGKEELSPEEDNEIDVWVSMYYDKKSGVIGYTNHNTKWTYLNSYFFDSFSYAEIAGNLFHEWTHKIGFEHDFERTSIRPYSVPYRLGYIIQDIINNIDDKPQRVITQSRIVCKRDWKYLWLRKKCYQIV